MRYYGGKSKLTDLIYNVVSNEFHTDFSIADAFAGTGVVGLHFRRLGHRVEANDILYFSHCLNVSNLCNSNLQRFQELGGVVKILDHLNNLPSRKGILTKHFSPSNTSVRQYLSAENAGKVDAIRIQIETWFQEGKIDLIAKETLIGLLLRAVNRVSNVTGTYAAYLKTWDPRSRNPAKLNLEDIQTNGPVGSSSNLEVMEFISSTAAEITYLDPPYNSRDYASNYFLLELIAMGGIPRGFEPTGVTGMVALPDKKSLFSSNRTVNKAFDELFDKIRSPITVLSYSNEGLLSIEHLKNKMAEFGEVEDIHTQHKRFRSINQDGSKKQLKEHLLILRKG